MMVHRRRRAAGASLISNHTPCQRRSATRDFQGILPLLYQVLIDPAPSPLLPHFMANSFQGLSCSSILSGTVPKPPSRVHSHARTQTLRRILAKRDFSLRRSSRLLSLTSTSQLSKLAPRPVSPGTTSLPPTSTVLRYSGARSTSKRGRSNPCTNLNYCHSSRNCNSVGRPTLGFTLPSSVPRICDIFMRWSICRNSRSWRWISPCFRLGSRSAWGTSRLRCDRYRWIIHAVLAVNCLAFLGCSQC